MPCSVIVSLLGYLHIYFSFESLTFAPKLCPTSCANTFIVIICGSSCVSVFCNIVIIPTLSRVKHTPPDLSEMYMTQRVKQVLSHITGKREGKSWIMFPQSTQFLTSSCTCQSTRYFQLISYRLPYIKHMFEISSCIRIKGVCGFARVKLCCVK